MAPDKSELEAEQALESNRQRVTVEQVIGAIWSERKRILLISLAAGLLTLGVSFLLPVYFKSQAVLLPETDKSKLGSTPQIASLASLAGISVPGGADISRPQTGS